MSKKTLSVLGALIVVSFVFTIINGTLVRNPDPKQITNASQDPYVQEKYANLAKAKAESANWPTYTDPQLGISLKYPPHDQRGPIKFFRVGNILFVAPETSKIYRRRDELTQKSDEDILSAAYAIDDFGYWKIWVRKTPDQDDLEKFIQERFRSFNGGCKFSDLTPAHQTGVYRVGIVPVEIYNDSNSVESSCWINFRLAFLYSPTAKRAATWDMGQDDYFPLFPYANGYAADDVMYQSFNFVEKTN